MELEFQKTSCKCLSRVLCEVRSLEQAQEIRLSDGMPDIGRVLCGWGQVLQRSKEWNGDTVSLTAGMQVRVLYAPEDGTAARWVEGWIPFQLSWDLPESTQEGSLQIRCLTRFVDARSVSARKIMVRAGISAMAEAWTPGEGQIYSPQSEVNGLELKKVRYPLRLPKEAGEKAFTLEEDLTVPGSQPELQKLVYYTLEPEIQEQRVLGDKSVFKGVARLHLMYQAPEGSFHCFDQALPFSQYAELEESRSSDAQLRVTMGITSLELEKQDETHLHLRCSVTASYLVEDLEVLELIQDAYSPGRDLQVQMDSLNLGAVLDTRRETVPVEQSIPGEGDNAIDVCFFPDFPRQRTLENGVGEELTGMLQVLYMGSDGTLQAAISRWEDRLTLPADGSCLVTAEVLQPSEPQILMGGGDMKVRTELPLQLTVTGAQGIPMVTGLELGEEQEPDENRPSLLLRRAGTADLWELAKRSGSTVAAIRAVNHLMEDPEPGQMLLIPIL